MMADVMFIFHYFLFFSSENEIDKNRLLKMPDVMIKELIPKMYPRYQFIEKLQALRDPNAVSRLYFYFR